jgi:hypothetical protein
VAAITNQRLPTWARPLAVLAIFVALTIVHTWPLATDPATLSRNENGDTMLNEWILAWVAHQLPRAPLRLFDANIFYPEPNTLAFSEHMFIQSLMGMPLFWLGASPVLVYNLLLMAAFALTGWTMYLVITHWTGDAVAGLAAGSLAAFNSYVFTRLPHLQALHVEFLPLAVAALHRLLTEPTSRRAIVLGVLFTAQGLTSNYWLAFISLTFVAAVALRPGDWLGARFRTFVPNAALAAGVAIAVTVPFLLPYYRVMRDQGFVRNLNEVALYSARWRDYVTSVNRVDYALWSHHVWEGVLSTALFPGFVALALALTALVAGIGWRDPRARLWLALAAASIALSFGTKLPGYATLYAAFPLLKGVRVPARIGHLALVAIAALAGFGVAYLRRLVAGRRWAPALAIGILVAIHVEALRAPLGFIPASLPGPDYETLARERRAVVVEFPMYPPRQAFFNAQYMLNSTRHWKPLVNGYSGFLPASYVPHYEQFIHFPDPPALRALVALGVTHVVVHHLPPSPIASGFGPMPAVDALQPIAASSAMTVYQLRWDRIDTGR